MQRGFSTLEMMIAMAVMVITLTAVILVSFSTQGALVGGQTNAEAMNIAQKALEEEQQLARKDFRLVSASSSAWDIYTSTTTVDSWSGDPYSSKKVTATVSWKDQRKQDRSVTLTTVLSNFTNAVGGDTCGAPTGDWSAPQSSDYQMTNSDLLGGVPSDTYTVGSLDAYRGKLYVAASKTGINSSPTLFAFTIANPPQKPQLVGYLDNAPTTVEGLNAIVAGNTALDGSGNAHAYAYAANAHGTNFDTCSQAANCSQLQVFDVTNATPVLAFNFKFATSSQSIPNALPYVRGTNGSQAVGKSVFYKDGYIYLGLTKTLSGPEFNIIDVHNPLNPQAIGAGFDVGAGVEAIYIRGKYAYLATDNSSQELVVLDISNPLAPTQVPAGSVYNPPGIGFGNALYAVGDKLYFGKTMAGGQPEFSIEDITNAGSGAPVLGTKVVGSSIAGLIVRGVFANVLTSTARQFKILNVSNTASPTDYASISVPGDGVALDCELNYLYAASNNGASGYISVIKPGP